MCTRNVTECLESGLKRTALMLILKLLPEPWNTTLSKGKTLLSSIVTLVRMVHKSAMMYLNVSNFIEFVLDIYP